MSENTQTSEPETTPNEPEPTAELSESQKDSEPEQESGRRNKKDVTCLVCNRRYRVLRADHLREHGLTRERYRRIYGGTSRSTDLRGVGSTDQNIKDPHLALIERLSTRVADSAGFLDALASECAEHILSAGPLRAQVAFAAAQVIQARVRIHADAVSRLSRVADHLDEPWRVEAGGRNGKPTPTKDLLAIAMQSHAEIVKAEEIVIKAARLALDEQKAHNERAVAPGFAYTGAAEGIAIPRNLSAPDREALRALMGNLEKHVRTTREVRQAIATTATAETRQQTATQPIALTAETIAQPAEPAGDPLAMTATPIPSRRRRPAG